MKAKTEKKEMKKGTVKTSDELQTEKDKARGLFTQKLLSDNNVTLSVTKKGAFQIRDRKRGVIMAGCRHNFKVTLPPEAIKKLAPGARPCEGNAHMSWVPYAEVTKKLIEMRLKDKRTVAEVEASVYSTGMSPCKTRYHEANKAVVEAEKAKAKAKGTKKDAKRVKKGKKKAPAALKAKVEAAKA